MLKRIWERLVAGLAETLRPPPETLIWESRWRDTLLQVWETPGRRELRFGNRVVQSALSRINPDHLVLRYTRFMMLGFVLLPRPARVLHIGMGAGTLPSYIFRHFPEVQQDIVEINPDVIRAAREHFDFPDDPHLQVYEGDAAEQISELPGPYDLIFLDAFDAHGTPPALMDPSFLALLRKRLTTEGWVVANTWSTTHVFPEFRKRWFLSFGRGLQARTRTAGNVILFGGNSLPPPSQKEVLNNARSLERQIPLEMVPAARKFSVWKGDGPQ
ncbi:MAG: fused MFS/spermidine synthase [bacterium]